jgi:hypothetical protein
MIIFKNKEGFNQYRKRALKTMLKLRMQRKVSDCPPFK